MFFALPVCYAMSLSRLYICNTQLVEFCTDQMILMLCTGEVTAALKKSKNGSLFLSESRLPRRWH